MTGLMKASSLAVCVSMLVFFFSSRRRHTIFSRDWSSDVCSSDLLEGHEDAGLAIHARSVHQELHREDRLAAAGPAANQSRPAARSEERRVGEELRCRRSPVAYRKSAEPTTHRRIGVQGYCLSCTW